MERSVVQVAGMAKVSVPAQIALQGKKAPMSSMKLIGLVPGL
jgi:hypothetical protein